MGPSTTMVWALQGFLGRRRQPKPGRFFLLRLKFPSRVLGFSQNRNGSFCFVMAWPSGRFLLGFLLYSRSQWREDRDGAPGARGVSSSIAASPTVAVGNISGVASSIHVPRVNGQNGRKPDKGIRWGLPLARFLENGENGAKW